MQSLAGMLDTSRRLYDLRGADGLLVEAFSLREGFSEPWELQLVCLSERSGFDLQALLGRTVTLHTVLSDGSRQPRSGRVLAAEADEADGGFARYRLQVRPWLALLTHTRRSQVWQDKGLQAIVDSVFADYPQAEWRWADDVAEHLRDSAFANDEGERSYTVQYRESDLDFVQRLLAEEGLVYRFEVGGALVILADTPRESSCPAHPNGEIRFHRDAPVEDSDTIQALGARRELPTATLTGLSWDYKAKRAVAASVPTAAAYGGRQAPRLESYDPTSPYAFATGRQAERALALAQQTLEARHKTFIGRSTVRDFTVGQTLRITGSPLDDPSEAAGGGAADDNTRFVLTSVVHAGINNLPKDANRRIAGVDDDGAGGAAADAGPGRDAGTAALLAPWVDAEVRRQAAASGYGNRFEAIRAHVPWRPLLSDASGARLNPRPVAAGPQTATVVGPAGQEIHCDALGRIRIQYHFQRHAEAPASADTSRGSTWVRVLQAHAGSGMGLQFIPRIGQEVLVDFIEGDIDRPLVIAALYDGQGEGGTPPTTGGREAKGGDTGANGADTGVFARSSDHRPGAQGNLAGGHAPAWHGAAAGQLAAGGQRNVAALSGWKTQEFGSSGAGFNQLVFDDSDQQLRLQLATTQHATQLNLGHLIHQADNHRGGFRGLGFELRTDAYGAVRAKQGVLISTYASQANEPAGDDAAGIALAGQLKTLGQTFSQGAGVHQTVKYAAHIGSVKAGAGVLDDKEPPLTALHTAVKGMVAANGPDEAAQDAQARRTATGEDKLPHTADPIVAVSAQAGLAAAAGQDVQWTAGDTIVMAAGQDSQHAVGGAYRLHTGQAIGMLGGAIQPGNQAAGKGLTLIAGQGDVDYQAQADRLQVAAKGNVAVQSQSAHVDWAAAKKIVLATAGGANITIEGGNITVTGPGKITVKAGKKSFVGPEQAAYGLPVLPRQVCVECLLNAAAAGSAFSLAG